MNRFLFLFSFLLISSFAVSQDMYHQELLSQLSNEYGVSNSSYVFTDNEATIANGLGFYGNLARQNVSADGFSFTRKIIVQVNGIGANVWDAGMNINNQSGIGQNDVVLVAFWAKKVSDDSELYFFIENASTFEKEVYAPLTLTQDWTQYFVAIKSSTAYQASRLSFGFHLASKIQQFEIGGYTALNLGQISLGDVPSIFSPGNYEGNEDDAPWRALAADRIQAIRKSDINITVRDSDGSPLQNAMVSVEMLEHEFGFGSAFVGCRFPGNDCYNAQYVSKIRNLDGQGHGFNVGVTENALKWDGWEEEWIGSPTETINAVQYLSDNGVKMRGHTLIWPGWGTMPDDMVQNAQDVSYMKNRINGRLGSMLTNPQLSQLIDEWDVLNEITFNRDLENSFRASPDYTTGRELYAEIFDKTTEFAPNNKNYINDYITLSNGGFGEGTKNLYKSFISEIINSGSKVDGIGFQCHIGSQPTSILKVENVLNEFYNEFNTRLKITEYDIDGKIDDAVQAKYLNDFLTMIFSHPGVDAFLMWGFWDGNHWKNNAPMFDQNWNLKPSGQAFNDLVFGEWWTNEQLNSDVNGKAGVNGFMGDYKIVVEYDGETSEQFISLGKEDVDVNIQFGTTSIEEQNPVKVSIYPNPTQGKINVAFDDEQGSVQLNTYDLMGKLIYQESNVQSGQLIDFAFSNGIYIIEVVTKGGLKSVQKLVVQ